MLNRLTVSALLKTVLLATTFCVVIGSSVNSWDAWTRLQLTSRISMVTAISANLFNAMNNVRSDRISTIRLLKADQPMDRAIEIYIRGLRDAEMPLISEALGQSASIEFAQQGTLVPELDRQFKLLAGLQAEFWTEVNKPLAARRPALPKEYLEATTTLLETLDKLSNTLAAEVNHQDPVIDQLLAIKQIAWLLRNTGGDASLVIANGLAVGHLQPEDRAKYLRLFGGTETAWAALELTASGMQLSPALSAAIAATKPAYFEPEYLALRDRLLTALIAGTPPEWTGNKWSEVNSPRLAVAVGVAQSALNSAKEHMLADHSAAERSLILQFVLLASALAWTFGAVMMVSRRIIIPLHKIRDAMLKVAAGDLAIDTGYAERPDEIGALACALETFKQQAVDKLRIENQERERNAGAAVRQQAIEGYVGEFEGMVRQTLAQLNDASGQMRTTSAGMSAFSSQTNARVQIAEKASGEASMSVESVASASEQLSASINDISRQAAHAAGIASRAVDQARETDGTVQGLAKTATRIGEVIGLINSIASQTNLLDRKSVV